jgi:hypothetical protein
MSASPQESASVREAVACMYCGKPTPMTGIRKCNNCWEVTHRLVEFVRYPKGRKFVRALLEKEKT